MSAHVDLFGSAVTRGKGMGGHQSAFSDKEVWLTPPDILAALGPFNLDPCACLEPRPWPTAAIHYTRADNGLAQSWVGRVWLNPPYGGPSVVGPWMRRLADHRCGTALIFARTETEVFHETVWDRADGVLFLRGRLHFHHSNGQRAEHNAGAPSCLVAYGLEDDFILSRCSLPGRYIRLRP